MERLLHGGLSFLWRISKCPGREHAQQSGADENAAVAFAAGSISDRIYKGVDISESGAHGNRLIFVNAALNVGAMVFKGIQF